MLRSLDVSKMGEKILKRKESKGASKPQRLLRTKTQLALTVKEKLKKERKKRNFGQLHVLKPAKSILKG